MDREALFTHQLHKGIDLGCDKSEIGRNSCSFSAVGGEFITERGAGSETDLDNAAAKHGNGGWPAWGDGAPARCAGVVPSSERWTRFAL